MIELLNQPLGYVFLGSFVGILLGLTGSGGGIVAIPILVFLLKLNLIEAIPISLMTVCVSAYIGTFIGLKNNLVKYKAVLLMFITSLITTPIGMYIAHQTPQEYLMMIFIILLVGGIKAMISKIRPSNLEDLAKDKEVPCKINERRWIIWNKKTFGLFSLIGLIIGFFSGLLGAAGGFVVVPTLSKISKFTMEEITATSLGVVALVGTANIIFSATNGFVNWDIGIWFTAGGCIGMFVGSLFSSKISQKALQVIYIAISVLTAIGLLISIIHNIK